MAVVFDLTLRQLLRGKRVILLALLPLAPTLVALAYGLSSSTDNPDAYAGVVETIYLPIVLAVVALVLGASALGDERDDGTVVYLATTPLARRTIVAGKLLAAWLAVTVLCLPGLIASLYFVFGASVTAGNLLRGTAAVLGCGAAYVSVFGLLSALTRRPVLVGFLYVVLWEGSIANFAPSAARLSIAAYGRAIVAPGLAGAQRFNVPATSTLVSLIVLAAVTVGGALYGGHRLARIELP